MASSKQGIAIEALRGALQGLQIPGSGSYLERDAPSQPLECFVGNPSVQQHEKRFCFLYTRPSMML
jgi:hypothetical protein